MLAKRIIPCLDVKNGRTVKGINFESLKDAGDPVELGFLYSQQGADELVYLDISASQEGRSTFTELVKKVAAKISIPFTVGGGVSTVEDVEKLLNAGADKVTVNTAAIENPNLINTLAAHFGSQCIVVAIDAKFESGKWAVYSHGGRKKTPLNLITWAKEVETRGAGEILFTSMNHDGTKDGFAVQALRELSDAVTIPVIASGGAGSMKHFKEAFELGTADAALAASVFHFGQISLHDLKIYLRKNDIAVRN
ncbi:MAG: imidazole glycerol phosphate synthase subunit HisF [Cyclobacteriaceae bacterium]|nr:imidazole glycerol phosphate synthase subunit HisF [Cyclobacteriaceae bacterium]